MRRLIITAAILLLAACATRPETPVAETPQPVGTAPAVRGLSGETVNQLIARFGHPALQVREGSSLKLQFRGPQCVLDAYLYPQGSGMRVTHVDARTPGGADVNQASCIAALDRSS